MSNPYAGYANTPGSIGTKAKYITPSDTVNFLDSDVPKVVQVVSGGDITVIGLDAPDGATGILLPATPAYYIIPFAVRKVLATGTNATKVLAIY